MEVEGGGGGVGRLTGSPTSLLSLRQQAWCNKYNNNLLQLATDSTVTALSVATTFTVMGRGGGVLPIFGW